MTGKTRKILAHWVVVLGLMLTGILSGCQTKFTDLPTDSSGNRLHVGDAVTVTGLSSTGNELFPAHSERIGEDGTITLTLINSVTAVGKTPSELQKEIHDRYVPRYYPEATITVRGEIRYFYVDGEVVARGQKEYPGDMTIVKAIAVAGGFTDFAKKTKVKLTRGGHTQVVNVEKAINDPKLDVPVFPRDKIYVPRRIL